MYGKCTSLTGVVALLAGVLLAACGASAPPKELLSAREAFQKAKLTGAQELAPVQLEEARQALSKAEATFQDEGDEPVTRYSAYAAERKALIAQSAATAEDYRRKKAQSEEQLKKLQMQIQEVTETKLVKTKEQLEKERLAAERLKEGVAKTQAELEAERKARLAAEQKLSAALASLDKIAQVKEEKRGVVITLSGSVLFATGKWELLPIAQNRLDDVAKALKDQGYKHILVEGHTDSQGSAQANYELSRKRAEAVREYLISRGIESSKIEAKGIGEDRPVADNSTPEGRANNRRVELIVTPES